MFVYLQKSFQFHPRKPFIFGHLFLDTPCHCVGMYCPHMHIHWCVCVYFQWFSTFWHCKMLYAHFMCSVFWEFNKNYIFLLGNAIRNQYLHKGTLFASGCHCFNFHSADRIRTCIWVNNLRNIHMYVNISICNYLSPLNQTWTHSAISNSNH